jgi:hypothetical protein
LHKAVSKVPLDKLEGNGSKAEEKYWRSPVDAPEYEVLRSHRIRFFVNEFPGAKENLLVAKHPVSIEE